MTSTVALTGDNERVSTTIRGRGMDGTKDAAFAALFASLQTGFGNGVLTQRAGATAGRAVSPLPQQDAHRRRLDRMTTQYRARVGQRQSTTSDPDVQVRNAGRRSQLESAAAPRQPEPRVLDAVRRELTEGGRPAAGGPGSSASTTVAAGSPALPAAVSETSTAPVSSGKVGTDAMGTGVSAVPVTSPPASLAPPVDGGGVPAVSAKGTAAANGGRGTTMGPSGAGPAEAAGGKTTGNIARQIAELLASRLEPGTTNRTARPSGKSADPSAEQGAQTKTAREANAKQTQTGSRTAREVFAKLVRGLRLNLGTGRSTARLRLNPPELGRVRVDVEMQDDRVSLRVEVEEASAGKLLRQRLDTLRHALREHGIVTERVELVTPRSTSPTAQAASAEHATPWAGGRHPGDSGANARHSEQETNQAAAASAAALDAMELPEDEEEAYVTVLDARLDIQG